jgi:alpha-mannosidase
MNHRIRWTKEKITQTLRLIEPFVYRNTSPLTSFRYLPLPDPITKPPVSIDVDDSSWEEIHPNEYWGSSQRNFTLRTWFTIPEDWDKSKPVALYLPFGDANDFSHPEALAYVDGIPFATCDRHHQDFLLRPEWADGKPHLLALHGWMGRLPSLQLYMRQCAAVQVHAPTRRLVTLLRVAIETVTILPEENPIRHSLLNVLDEAFQALDTREPLGENFYSSVEPALAVLESGLHKAGAPLDVTVHATGHAHIDVAWLWTLGQTRRKAERTFHTVIQLMEQFPEYHFSQSQPQLYEFIRQDQPELFDAIRKKVQEGHWEPMGGMWVEADCNLSGAESLARQFLLGRTYFREQFGKEAESPVLWLPDVFGYAWALPQLIRQAGLKYFMTIKIGWNQYNRLPYDTFLWQGLDGTQILTHFSTVMELGSPWFSTYNSMANPREALGAWTNFQQKDLHRDLLMAYGYGDGGGGPTREMLENIEVMKDFPGLPQVQQSSVKTFFESIDPLTPSTKMPVWNGELYLEYHRGTYTTQARNKRANRKTEFLLHDAEFLAAYATMLNPEYRYPHDQFTEAWRTVCLNQFHDILPGSSIGEVYKESLAQYEAVMKATTALRDAALSAISDQSSGDVLVANPTSFTHKDPAFLPGEFSSGLARDGQSLMIQKVDGGTLVDVGEIPPYSVISLNAAKEAATTSQPQSTSDHVLENDHLCVEFNQAGDITRIFDKSMQREVLPAGEVANQFLAFEDRPKDFDAWDIDIYYDDKKWLAGPAVSIRRIEHGPLRQTLEIKRKILNSEYTQQVSLAHNSARLDFDTVILWNERHMLLKVAFPVDVLSPQATYEIQWGNVQRPTHRNTSWDWARFETCAHKWVDLSEGDYGVSLLNDCKYGHDIQANVMRLTLLRSPTMPDPTADAGEHHFVYSLLPHSGGWQEQTQVEAYALNDPPIAWKNNPKIKERRVIDSLVSVSAPNVIIETVKQAENGDGIIVRLYESQRRRGMVEVRFAAKLKEAWETNLLEENQSSINVIGNRVTLSMKPYQIMTIRLKPGE